MAEFSSLISSSLSRSRALSLNLSLSLQNNLLSQLRFARALGRTLVLDRPNLSPLHNHGNPLQTPWSIYYDVKRTTIQGTLAPIVPAHTLHTIEGINASTTLKIKWNAPISGAQVSFIIYFILSYD
tara:strand:- start:174 stop:551 length:378 start_codon:yes stop_codon:yes gene_type:complete